MRIHYLQHVPFEDLGIMEPYFQEKAWSITSTQMYKNESLPSLDSFDWLIVMGGPMGIYDHEEHPWLEAEKEFIKSAIDSNKLVLGICLGAQLIAGVLGAKVVKNKYREIGWFPISKYPEANISALGNSIPRQELVFHWHGDTFDIPLGAIKLAESRACKNQGFVYNDRVVALQFHLETTEDSARALIENCKDELDGSEFVQDETTILEDSAKFKRIHVLLFSVLTAMESQV